MYDVQAKLSAWKQAQDEQDCWAVCVLLLTCRPMRVTKRPIKLMRVLFRAVCSTPDLATLSPEMTTRLATLHATCAPLAVCLLKCENKRHFTSMA